MSKLANIWSARSHAANPSNLGLRIRRTPIATLLALAAAIALAASPAFAQQPGQSLDGLVLQESADGQLSVETLGAAISSPSAAAAFGDDESSAENGASQPAVDTLSTFGAGDRVWVDRGCGNTYDVGDPIRINMRVDYGGYYTLRIGSASGHRDYLVGLPGGMTVYVKGTVGQPNGQRTVRLIGNGTDERCDFMVGSQAQPTPPPTPAPTGGLRLAGLHAADDLLQPATCIRSGDRVYFVARVTNDGSSVVRATVSLMTKGTISSWWPQRTDTKDLQPGETWQFLAYADGYRDGRYEIKALVHSDGVEADAKTGAFQIGGCS